MSRNMDISQAINALSALAQESRLKVFRLLLRVGSEGMAAGDIARKLAVPHNTLSVHLTVLARANLVYARKEGRSVIYAANLEGTRALLTYLIEDCCRGKPDTCLPLIKATLAGCCTSECCT
jgi:ArsR family transcriptional regulator, arsenate/arsenite/antimonite-responsive transcriptional repressor